MGSSNMPVSLRAASARQSTRGNIPAISIDLVRNIVFILFVLRWTRKTALQFKGRGIVGSSIDAYVHVRRVLYGAFLKLPGVREKVQSSLAEATAGLEKKLIPTGPGVIHYKALPRDGWSTEQVRAELAKLDEMEHTKWEEGFVTGAVYHGGDDLLELQAEAFRKFGVANPIHPDVFPGVRKMEAEVVAMVLSLFHAPPGAAGTTTAGGTESILMACLSARQKAYQERGVTEPEMIVPETAHAAFRKACDYFKIRCHLVDCPAPSYKVNINAVRRLVNSNTILLVGSAPNYPHGITDNITALSSLALRKKIPLHVDCCLGSFMIAFLSRAGFPSEPFDFQLKGVTSISCDTHKYGFAPKGSSTVLYRNQQLRSYQYYVSPDWSGGVYASPGIAGSRPGALIAGCWASMVRMGENGYIEACTKIVGAAKRFEAAVREHPILSGDLFVLGEPQVSVVAFGSSNLNVYDISDEMSKRGWHLAACQSPPALHMAFTLPVVSACDRLIEDLASVVEAEREKERVRVAEGKPKKGPAGGSTAALYGVAGSLPNKSVVVSLATVFLDTLYKTV